MEREGVEEGPDAPGWDWSVAALLTSVFCAAASAMALITALGKQVYDLTGRELDLGWLGLAEFAPAAVLVLFTGALADRRDRRRLATTALAAQAAVALGLAAYAGSEPTSATPIFGLVVLFGVGRAFAAPASRALPADVVGPDRLPSLVARFSVAWQAATVVGPVLGGFLLTVDPRLPYVASSGLMLAAAAATLAIRLEPNRRPPPDGLRPVSTRWREALEGVRFIRRAPVLLGAISLDLFAVLFGGAIALLPAIATDRLGVDAVGLGWLRAAGGLGAGAVALGLALRPLRRRVGATLLAAVVVFGLGTIVLGLTHSYAVAFVAMFILSGADAVSVFVRATLVPLVTPAETRGRVLAVEHVFIGASNELGAFESGVVGQALGPAGAVVLGGSAAVVLATGWWFLFPSLRRVDRFPGLGRGEPLPPAPAPVL